MDEIGAHVSLKGARKAQRDAKDTARAVDDIGDEARQAGRKLGQMNAASRGLGGGLRGLGTGAAFAVAGAGALTAAFGIKTYKAFDESRRIVALTEAHIRSTGGAANVTADDVGNLSGALSEKTGMDDEAIQTGANLLLTFKQIRNETGKGNDIFDQATAAALDLSVSGFGSIDGASKQLGKALNDPVKGMTALGRAGVTFTEGQKKQIERLVESGDLLSAQKIILAEVQSQVGGSAANQASNVDRLKVTVGNLQEGIGKGLHPVVEEVSGELHELGKDILPDVESAAGRVAGIFGSENLDLGDKFRFSGRAIGQELGPELRPMVAQIERELGGVDAGEVLGDAIRKGAPIMADAMAAQVPHMASAFASAFVNAGPGGQLLTVGLIAAKLGAFRGAGGLAAGHFLGGFQQRATTSGTFSSVGRSGGTAMGNGLVLHGSDAIRNGAKGGKFAGAGAAMGSALGVAAAVPLMLELEKGVDGFIAQLQNAGGVKGALGDILGVVDDANIVGKYGPLGPIIKAGEDTKDRIDRIRGTDERSQRQRNSVTPASPSTRTGRLAPSGPAALPSRGASMGLPEAGVSGGESLTFSGPLVIQLADGTKLHEQNVRVEARRARRGG